MSGFAPSCVTRRCNVRTSWPLPDRYAFDHRVAATGLGQRRLRLLHGRAKKRLDRRRIEHGLIIEPDEPPLRSAAFQKLAGIRQFRTIDEIEIDASWIDG